MRRRVPISPVLATLTLFMVGCNLDQATTPLAPSNKAVLTGNVITHSYSLNPSQSFLRAESGDVALGALVLDLRALGVAPGDEIRLQRVGDFDYSVHDTQNTPDNATALAGVFSSSPILLFQGDQFRVPGAISTGYTFFSGPTLREGLPTDIPEDFYIDDNVITVPPNATHLFIGAVDSYYSDNVDPNNNFGVIVTTSGPSCTLKSIAVKPTSVVAGSTLKGTVELESAAQTPIPIEITTQRIGSEGTVPVSVPATVTIPVGATSKVFDIATSNVNYPVKVEITAKGCEVRRKTEVLVEPMKIAQNGASADARVQAIVNEFLANRTYPQALDAIILARNADPRAAADVYLAAADHYLFAVEWIVENPEQLPVAAVFVPMYDILKLSTTVRELIKTGPHAASAPTQLSVDWGLKGIVDGVRLLLRDIRGGRF